MKKTLIKNVIVVNEGKQYKASVTIDGEIIKKIVTHEECSDEEFDTVIDGSNQYLLPGIIDDHVHFRDPGLTQKGDISSESCAAVAGGVTSIMDMPNTTPQTTSLEALEEKLKLMANKCHTNYSCYFGATNQNVDILPQLDRHNICGVKVFMGASTGNMLVDRLKSLEAIFNNTNLLIATHCENQDLIRQNTQHYKQQNGNPDDLPLKYHPIIRSEEACFQSSSLAVRLAKESGARLHILHISTARELSLFDNKPLTEKQITAEACIGHLLFSDNDYEKFGTRIKCNPAIKTLEDRNTLRKAVSDGIIDVIATDHAPHLLSDKDGGALKAASGIPMIQFSLVSMLELVNQGVFSIEQIVQKMAHAPSAIYKINNRGYIREGYQADLVLVQKNDPWIVTQPLIQSSCKWSPFEKEQFNWKVKKTFVNGNLVYDNGEVDKSYHGQQLKFI